MTEFVGRTGAQRVYSYPDPPRFSSLNGPFARNFAFGPPATETPIPIETSGTLLPWAAVGSAPLWSSTTTYKIGDIVNVLISAGHLKSFISLINGNIGNDPTSSPLAWDPNTDVPITPVSTGFTRITGMITVANTTGAPITLSIQIQIGGVVLPVPFEEGFTVPADGAVAIPIVAETSPSGTPGTPIGTTSEIQVLLTASAPGVVFAPESSVLDVQEAQIPTG